MTATADSTPIRTPDQCLRVFVSSTLAELAEERAAVSGAISSLRLTPVLFELGARPHPPQDLYRAYLAQSDIFVGLYWQRYGWVGPGMDISGLEDEFQLSRPLPRLLYLKRPAPDLEPRLADMLKSIEAEGSHSYRVFDTPEELDRLVRDDLAVLLSERFAAAQARGGTAETPAPRHDLPLPVGTTSLIGREQAIDEVAALIERPDTRLVTLTGPGGIGKTRLAMAVGERLQPHAPGRTVFAPLAAVSRPEMVVPAIARLAGADMSGAGSPVDDLAEYLGEGSWLLILDNLEHVVGAAPDFGELLARCPGTTILASSRTALQLRAERECPVAPLAHPKDADASTMTLEELAASPAVALFVDRAAAVRPAFALTDDIAGAVVEICRKLDGVPLAIELAAARIRTLDPPALLGRLSKSLDALGSGTVDLPERQRTLRATVEWSVGLLDDDERALLETVSVFVDSWTVEAAAAVAGIDDDRALELTESLARHSLIQLDVTTVGLRLRMLGAVREFMSRRLVERADAVEIGRRHAEHYKMLAEAADMPLRKAAHNGWADRLETDAGNLAAAVRWYLDHDVEPLPHLFRVLWGFWTSRDHLREGLTWVQELLERGHSFDPESSAELAWTAAVSATEMADDAAVEAARNRLIPLVAGIEDPYLHAVSALAVVWGDPVIDGDFELALRDAAASVELLRALDEPFWTVLALCSMANGEIGAGRFDDALSHIAEARELTDTFDSEWLSAYVRVTRGSLEVARGRYDEARALLEEGLEFGLGAHSTNVLTHCLSSFAWLAFGQGDAEHAALMAGAANGLRERVGLRAWPMQRQAEAAMADQLRSILGASRFKDIFSTGSGLNRYEAVDAAKQPR